VGERQKGWSARSPAVPRVRNVLPIAREFGLSAQDGDYLELAFRGGASLAARFTGTERPRAQHLTDWQCIKIALHAPNLVDTQNITLTIPRKLLKQIQKLAAKRDTSVSALMVQALSSLADEDRRYSAARKCALAALTEAQSLDTNGTVNGSRDELHERQTY
jgi:hypothetical protein